MENDGFLLMVEELCEALELWDSSCLLTVKVWPLSNLPLQSSLLTEALWLSSVFPGLRLLILTKMIMEAGGCLVTSPAHYTEAEAEEEGEEDPGAHHQQGEGRHQVLQGEEKVTQRVLAVSGVVAQNNIMLRREVGQYVLGQDLTCVHHDITGQCSPLGIS